MTNTIAVLGYGRSNSIATGGHGRISTPEARIAADTRIFGVSTSAASSFEVSTEAKMDFGIGAGEEMDFAV